MFTGFTQDTVDFLWNIRFNNDRAWFEENKQTYLSHVQRPMKALGEALYAYMADHYPKLGLNLHVSRIYRDARRLFGRGPYKDHLWLSLRVESEAWTCRPVFYFEISPELCSYGMGFYSATAQTMERFRRETAANPRPMEDLARKLQRQEDFHLEGPEYARKKTAPSPILEPWISRKSLSLCCDRPYDELVFTPALLERVEGGFDFLVPYYERFAALCTQE
ncbi:MAG: DUF2461 domain-containing protein [Oscillospiraceae bacterium]|nr:DUF2461 domain-containing protein [Oscillospiraceae bacterium]